MPPPSPATIADISQPNNEWGICGFASTLAALCENQIVSLGGIPAKYIQDIDLEVVSEYLNTLMREGSPLVQQIEAFTHEFEGFENFTVRDFVQRIYNANIQGDFGVAMTSGAVMDLLKRYGARPYQLATIDTKRGNCILGLGTGEAAKLEKGLQHWVYMVNEGKVYNYGKVDTLSNVTRGYQVVYQICL